MKTSQWIKDIRTAIGCEPPQLFKVLANIANKEEDSDRGLFARKTQSKILECIEAVKPFLGEIRRNAQDFTLHDIQHCINVIDFMGQMLVDVNKLNPAEISFFIYAALLHDIGMVKLQGEDISLNDLREDHGERSARFIRERVLVSNDDKPFSFGEWDEVYIEYLPPICASHMQEFSFVEILPQSYFLDGMEVDMSLCAILLRVADAMDLKRNRAPYQLYQFIVYRSISEEHWKKHLSISNCQVNEKGIFRVDGICHDEAAHRCLYNHLDTIESEIEKVLKWKSGPHPRLKLSSHIVERNINTQGYKMWHHSFEMDVLKIKNLLMGEQLYGDRKLGLREIIQNSIDACMVRDEMNKKLGAKQDLDYEPKIYIIIDGEHNQVIIRDNGTGMNDYIIQNYFLNIGASYYSSYDFKKKNLEYSPSGYFGIGFLACFMLSDDVYVRTAHWQEDKEYEFHFIKSDKFVTKTEKPKSFSGTEIKLNLDQFKNAFSPYSIEESIEDEIIHFFYYNFWNVITEKKKDHVILCELSETKFINYAKSITRFNNTYNIDLSDYLIGIEGIIQISSSDLYNKMKYFANLNEVCPLDAIKKGYLNISENIIESLPFVKHFYTYNSLLNTFVEIDNSNNTSFQKIIFFTTEDSNLKPEHIIRNDHILSDEDIKEYFSTYKWNCICIPTSVKPDNYLSDFMFTISYSTYDLNESKKESTYLHKLISFIGYYPSCYISAEGFNTEILSELLLNNTLEGFVGNYWLKHSRIDLSSGFLYSYSFTYFTVKSIIMKMSNPLITPDSSRKNIVGTSVYKLLKAISNCIIVWVYDQIKNNNEAVITEKYLRKLILKEWDKSVEGLMVPEKKPV